MAEQKGCVAHIVRLAENQRLSKIDPRGVDFRIYLIINETNNVCNAPFLLRRGIPHPFSDKEKSQPAIYQLIGFLWSGPDGTRTRDPVRDRHVF